MRRWFTDVVVSLTHRDSCASHALIERMEEETEVKVRSWECVFSLNISGIRNAGPSRNEA